MVTTPRDSIPGKEAQAVANLGVFRPPLIYLASILITGATGTVGREVVKRLSAQGVEVRAVTRDPRKAGAHSLPHVQFVQGEL